MRIADPKPKEYSSTWPAFALDPNESYGYSASRIRAAIPTAFEIAAMEEILAWVNLVPNARHRRIIRLRSLIHPIRQSHVYTWARIAAEVWCSVLTAQRWYEQGINTLLAELPAEDISSVLSLLDRRSQVAQASARALEDSMGVGGAPA